jgi:hypothetical protein
MVLGDRLGNRLESLDEPAVASLPSQLPQLREER